MIGEVRLEDYGGGSLLRDVGLKLYRQALRMPTYQASWRQGLSTCAVQCPVQLQAISCPASQAFGQMLAAVNAVAQHSLQFFGVVAWSAKTPQSASKDQKSASNKYKLPAKDWCAGLCLRKKEFLPLQTMLALWPATGRDPQNNRPQQREAFSCSATPTAF